MQPTPTPTPAPNPSATDPVTELIRTQRQNVGFALLILAAVFLGATVMLGLKASRVAPAVETKTEKDKDSEEALRAIQVDTPDVKALNKYDYVLGSFGAGLGLLIVAGAGAYFLVALPKPTEALQRTEARVAVLAVGGLLGSLLIVLGALYFYRWSDSLIGWLDKGETKQARWVLFPLLMVLIGGGLVFVSSQPARAEERNNTPIRRLIYGSNLGFATLLVLVLLIVLNIAIGPRLPNRLDTTGSGFYSINPQTQQLVEGLDQPIHAYAIFQDGDLVNEDAKRLLLKCQDVNPGKFRVTVLSPALNRRDIEKLRSDFPMAEMSREGILLVMGDEDSPNERKRHTFVRGDDLGENKTDANGRPMLVFNGEPKLLRELMYLAENKQRPKIYFTQSSGELSLSGGAPNPRRAATELRKYLERNYFDVAELTFDVGTPAKVPDDAAVVVVADPTVPLPPNGVTAITKFMNEPRSDGKKGKLVLLAGLQRGADDKPLQSGLEPVLASFGVRLSDRFMYSVPNERADPRDQELGTRVTLAVINPEGVAAQNPVALGFNKVERLPLLDCREVSAVPATGFQTVTVLSSMADRPTWTEPLYTSSPFKTWSDFEDQVQKIAEGPGTREQKQKLINDLVAQKQFSRRSRNLAIFVSETGAASTTPTARVAVFGCGWFVSDDASRQATRGQVATLWLDLMGSTLDWVRDRPTIRGIEEKPYTTYTLKPGYDDMRMKWAPILLSCLIYLVLGAGVWVMRRK